MHTFEEVKNKLQNSDKLPDGIRITCACGKHVEIPKLTDDDIREIVKILNDDSYTMINGKAVKDSDSMT